MSKSISPVTPRPERLRFPAAARIRLTREFAFVRREGRTAQGRFLRLTGAKKPGPSRFGLVTSKGVGGAVTRNRVRRRLREICRLHRQEVSAGWMLVVTAKTTAAAATFEELHEEWLLLGSRLSIFPAPQ